MALPVNYMHGAISHASRRPPDVILRMSFTRPSTTLGDRRPGNEAIKSGRLLLYTSKECYFSKRKQTQKPTKQDGNDSRLVPVVVVVVVVVVFVVVVVWQIILLLCHLQQHFQNAIAEHSLGSRRVHMMHKYLVIAFFCPKKVIWLYHVLCIHVIMYKCYV